MAVYSDTIAVPAAFTTEPSFTVPFQPKTIAVVNENTTAANVIEVSFDGINVHGKLIPGLLAGFKWDQNTTKVWLQGVGSAVGRIIAED